MQRQPIIRWPWAAAETCNLALADSCRASIRYSVGLPQVRGQVTGGSVLVTVGLVAKNTTVAGRQAMGLAQVRHWARLLPLLLAWAAGPDAGARARALRALHAALRAGWPRLPPHARLVWRHLAATAAWGPALGAEGAREPDEGGGATPAAPQPAHAREAGQGLGNAAEEGRWAAAVAEVLWWAGGEAFREEVRGGSEAAGGPGGCRLRAHVLALAPGPAAGVV